MTRQRAFLFQTLFEAAIPVVGYFEWGWDLSFILLFYLLDWLLAFGILIAKGRKRLVYSGDRSERHLLIQHSMIGFLLLITACAGIATSIVFLQPGLDWAERIRAFLTYADMGIAQGWFLVPLMVLNGVMVYRQQFLMTAKYRVQDMAHMTRPFVQQGFILLGCAGLLLGLTALISFPQEILIGVLIVGTSAYRWLVIRRS